MLFRSARARRIFEKLPDSGTSEYLKRKGVRAYGLRFSRGSIVVPVRDERGDLVGLQFIDGEGAKKFLTGTAKRGAWHWVGELGNRGPVAIAEGYATAATIHEATGWPEEGFAPGTRWEQIPDDWSCPDCSASKSDFQLMAG